MPYYTSSYALRQTHTIRRNRNSVHIKKSNTGLGPITNIITLAVILSLLGLLYLTQITKQTTYGYEINTLKTQKTELLSQQSSLEVEAARLQALDRVKNSSVAKTLVEPDLVQFANR